MFQDQEKDHNKHGITRRSFLKASSVSALALTLPHSKSVFKTTSVKAADKNDVKVVRTVCAPNCTGSCAINAYVKDNKIIKIEPGEFPDPSYKRICLKGISNAMQRVYHPDRVKYPMKRAGKRGEDKWERISWDEALDTIAKKLTEVKEEYGARSCSWMSMTGNYGINAMSIASRIANSFGGTQFENLGIMGDLATNMAYVPMLGVLQEGHDWHELTGSRMILMFGCNFSDTSPNDMHFIFDAQEAGAKLIVVDPRFSKTASKADWWIPIRPGTDGALAMSMMYVIIKENLQNDEYIRNYTNGPFLVRSDNGKFVREKDLGGSSEDYVVWDSVSNSAKSLKDSPQAMLTGEYTLTLGGVSVICKPSYQFILESVEEFSPENASKITEVPAEDIRKLALMYAQTDPAAIRLSQGIQRYYQGHLSCRSIITLGAITGNIGKKHAGVSWAGGTLFKMIAATPPEWLAPIPNFKGEKLPGTKLYDIIPSEKPWPIKTLWLLSYGMGTQAPEMNKLINEVFPKLDLIVVSEQVMTPITKYADIVLPVTSYYEEECDAVGAWSNLYVQFRRQAIKPLWEAKTDWDCFKELSKRLGFEEYWKMSQQESAEFVVKNAIDPVISGTSIKELREKGVARANLPEGFVPFADQKFNTPSGRVEIYLEDLTEFDEANLVYKEPIESNRQPKAKKYPLTFMNVRTVYSAHSQHVILPWINEVHPEPRIEINPIDAKVRGLKDGDLVEVFNDRGKFKVKTMVTEGIKPGCVNIYEGWWPKHFPEGHYSHLLHMKINPAQDAIIETNFAPYDNLVEIKKV